MPLLEEVVPQELRTRPYLQDILKKEQAEGLPDVFKKLDNAESLIGRRPAIPGKDAKPEDLDKFFEGFRPEKPEDYQMQVDKDAKPDPKFLSAVQRAFHMGNLSPRQAQRFMEDFQKSMKEYVTEQGKAQAALKVKADQEFEEIAKIGLGEKNKPILDRAWKVIDENTPAAYKNLLPKLDPKLRVVLAAVVNSVFEKYAPADELNPNGDRSREGDLETERAEIKKLQAKLVKMDMMDPEYEPSRQKVNDFYKRLGEKGK